MCSIRGQSTTTILENIDIAPNLPSIDIASFTHDLVSNADTDKDKIWTIYKYVIDHISYDKSAYKNGIRRINRNNSDVLRRKTAVCWGYSELIREMCSYAGIKCLSISGYARDLQIPSRSFEKANHAWNAVRLNGEWFLLDATWASGISSEEDYFMSVYGVDYFLTPPALFIKNHFPLLPMWQLLSCPLSLEEFYAESDVRRESCSFKYNRHINKFLELSNLEQEAQTITIAYRMNRSQKNRKLLGHALVDIAIEKKEAGEEYFEANQEEFAIEQLEASLQLFEIASEYCKLYPWQEYAYVITSINLVQAYYFLYDEDIDRYPFILSQFLESRLLVEKSNMDIIVKEHAYKSIDRYIEILVETISLMTADSQ
ncbi:MAG: hypothetical protein ACI9FN_000807 [Saprospiraceae bacterium]|jgi:hypothetical protein